jgi:TyrR family helix-turn-helix protein
MQKQIGKKAGQSPLQGNGKTRATERNCPEDLERAYGAMACGILSLAPDGTVQYLNKAARKALGMEAGAVAPTRVEVPWPSGDIGTATPNRARICGQSWILHPMQKLSPERADSDVAFFMIPEQAFGAVFDTESAFAKAQETFRSVIDCIFDQIYVIDKSGKVLMVNEAVRKMDYMQTDIEGRNMRDLVAEGFSDSALCFDVIRTGKAAGRIFKEDQGYDLFSWCVPHFSGGEVDFVVCTEWDLDNLVYMRNLVESGADSRGDRFFPELAYYRRRSASDHAFIGRSPEMQTMLRLAGRLARSDSTVLICGESGTGKELLAKYIYDNSERANGPLIEINCGAIPESLIESELFGYEKGAFTSASAKGKIGLFEAANRGTIFLDEVAEIPYGAQAKLLRVLQEKEMFRVGGSVPIPLDVRVIAATNQDLMRSVEKNRFREDLYYRLNVLPITVPPLRDRKGDIPLLIEYFTERFNSTRGSDRHKSVSPKDYDLFLNHSWPGNVRELENLIERAFLVTREKVVPRTVWMSDLSAGWNGAGQPQAMPEGGVSLRGLVEAYEKELLASFLPLYQNSRQFAKMLGMDKSSINRKLAKYGIRREDV